MDVPVIEDEYTPSIADRLKQIVEWADGDRIKLSAGFLAYENEGEDVDDYLFQIAFIKDGCLVTNKKTIEDTGEHCVEYKEWKEYTKILFDIRRHLEMYFWKIDSIPPWGTVEYVKLKMQGSTPRVLEGPHKGGRLKPNQKRWVIINASNEIVFGPMI